MNVAWKIAVCFLCVSQKTISKGALKKVRKGLPETGEADIDKKISAASGDEKDAERWN